MPSRHRYKVDNANTNKKNPKNKQNKPAVKTGRDKTNQAAPAAPKQAKKTKTGPDTGFDGPIGRYNPLRAHEPACSKEEWETIAPLVRKTAAKLNITKEGTVQPFLATMTRLSVWALREGLPLETRTLLSPAIIEQYAAGVHGNSSTIRWHLRRMAAANGINPGPTQIKYRRSPYSAPYTLNEIQALLEFGKATSDDSRGRQLVGCVLLGAGCGFARGEVRAVGRQNVHQHDHGPDAQWFVQNDRRCVPLLDEFQVEMTSYLEWCGDTPFVISWDNGEITSKLALWVGLREGLPRFSTDRMRAYFIVEQIKRGLPLVELLAVCGLENADALDPYLMFVDRTQKTCPKESNGAS
jgi:hypothetical protein